MACKNNITRLFGWQIKTFIKKPETNKLYLATCEHTPMEAHTIAEVEHFHEDDTQ